MKSLLCLGDSITEGKSGSTYINYFSSDISVSNHGLGGDTIIGLRKRFNTLDISQFTHLIFECGGNDILLPYFALTYPEWKTAIKHITNRGSVPTKSKKEFIDNYKLLIEDSLKYNLKTGIINIPVISEDLNFILNDTVKEYNMALQELSNEYNITYIDFFSWQKDLVSGNPYLLGKSPLIMEADSIKCQKPGGEESLCQERGLNLTIDGVHLNKKSAKKLAEMAENQFLR